MSTCSNIYLKLKDESKGQTIVFDFNKLPGLHNPVPEFAIPNVTIPKNAEYIGIYHHWDGYITGVGRTLVENYKEYDTILNMLSMGDMSSINDEVTSYRGWRNEDTPPLIISKGTKVSHWVSYKTPKVKSVVTDMFGRVLKDKVVPDPDKFEKTELIKEYGHWVKRPVLAKDGTLDPKNALREEYAYLFDGEKWWVSYDEYDEKDDKYVHIGWVELEPLVKKQVKEEEES